MYAVDDRMASGPEVSQRPTWAPVREPRGCQLNTRKPPETGLAKPWPIYGIVALRAPRKRPFLADLSPKSRGLIIPWSKVRVLVGPPSPRAVTREFFARAGDPPRRAGTRDFLPAETDPARRSRKREVVALAWPESSHGGSPFPAAPHARAARHIRVRKSGESVRTDHLRGKPWDATEPALLCGVQESGRRHRRGCVHAGLHTTSLRPDDPHRRACARGGVTLFL